ncbi:MTFP1 protein, partial [Calyptomena viridis]|nr:MTFP1 protein [Calyptomena viridis]
GYANKVGESFHSLVPVVWASYSMATAYMMSRSTNIIVMVHVQDPTWVGVDVVDTFVWQGLASVAIPGFTINWLCVASVALLGTLTCWPLCHWATTTLGLAAIPLTITPTDSSILMDSSLCKLYGTPGEPLTPH